MAERNEKGHFIKGHKPYRNSTGRPSRPAEEAAFDDWHAVVTGAKRRKVIKKLLEMALAGDFRCIKLIITYELGTPIQRIEAEMDSSSAINIRYQQVLERMRDVDDG